MSVCIYIKTWLLKKCSQHGRLVCANGDGRQGEWHFSQEVTRRNGRNSHPQNTHLEKPPMPVENSSRVLGSEILGLSTLVTASPQVWMAAVSHLPGPWGQGCHPGLSSSCSLPLLCCSADSAQLITIHREPVWGFLICRGFHRGLQTHSTGPGHPKSHSPDQEIRLSDLNCVTEEHCGRGREMGDEILASKGPS